MQLRNKYRSRATLDNKLLRRKKKKKCIEDKYG